MDRNCHPCTTDKGPHPTVVDIDTYTNHNTNYRTALWTGEHLQVTLMCIPPGGDIGLEMHSDTDQFIRIESGCGLVEMGCKKNSLTLRQSVNCHYAVMIPAGTWHNITNTGCKPLKVYSLYAPPHHPYCTVERTKE